MSQEDENEICFGSPEEPMRLSDICLNFIAVDLSVVCEYNEDIGDLMLHDGLILPQEICEDLFHAYQNIYPITDRFVTLFRDCQRTRIKRIHIDKGLITDRGLSILAMHNLQEIYLNKCEELTIDTLEFITAFSSELVTLHIGHDVPFFTEWNSEWHDSGYSFYGPNMRNLIMNRQPYPSVHLQMLMNLTYLDFSECAAVANVTHLHPLNNLLTLILFNVPCMPEIFDWICSMEKLRRLDVSQSNERMGRHANPNQILQRIIRSLPDLDELDISGTNLAGTGVAGDGCDIPGLADRMSRPLSFLGLYGTLHAACCRHDIPAIQITGHANEDQIIAAATAYMYRPELLTRVLNDLYHLFRYENDKSVDIAKALAIVLEALEKHISEKHIQISGSATLFYIVKGKDRPPLSTQVKRRIVSALLNGMELHMEDDTMMRNGCLTLCQFKIPNDVVFQYRRVVMVLLHGVSDLHQEGFVQRVAIYLLNSLACQVDGGQKQFLGDSGAISKMLMLIADRLERELCDDVLEVAWSTMWNVTDETPDNCRRFLQDRGMDYFVSCFDKFPDREELLRNMMGLLGNVAEVAELRPVFMTSHFLTVFSNLLESTSDGIEVSYNAAGVLAHLASDGPEAWTVQDPSRESVLHRMEEALHRWNLSTKRNINYRSFQPILSLLTAYHTPQCQHWALWALANLTTVYPEKYCSLVEMEKGGDLLKQMIDHPDPSAEMKTLAKLVWHNCYY